LAIDDEFRRGSLKDGVVDDGAGHPAHDIATGFEHLEPEVERVQWRQGAGGVDADQREHTMAARGVHSGADGSTGYRHDSEGARDLGESAQADRL
jgi:hypothetical protein